MEIKRKYPGSQIYMPFMTADNPQRIMQIRMPHTHVEQKVLSGSFKGSLEWYCGGTPKWFFQAPFTRVLWKKN